MRRELVNKMSTGTASEEFEIYMMQQKLLDSKLTQHLNDIKVMLKSPKEDHVLRAPSVDAAWENVERLIIRQTARQEEALREMSNQIGSLGERISKQRGILLDSDSDNEGKDSALFCDVQDGAERDCFSRSSQPRITDGSDESILKSPINQRRDGTSLKSTYPGSSPYTPSAAAAPPPAHAHNECPRKPPSPGIRPYSRLEGRMHILSDEEDEDGHGCSGVMTLPPHQARRKSSSSSVPAADDVDTFLSVRRSHLEIAVPEQEAGRRDGKVTNVRLEEPGGCAGQGGDEQGRQRSTGGAGFSPQAWFAAAMSEIHSEDASKTQIDSYSSLSSLGENTRPSRRRVHLANDIAWLHRSPGHGGRSRKESDRHLQDGVTRLAARCLPPSNTSDRHDRYGRFVHNIRIETDDDTPRREGSSVGETGSSLRS